MVGKQHSKHLQHCIQKHYTLDVSYTGSLYCPIHLNWDCQTQTLIISMPGYIRKQLEEYKHPMLMKSQVSPFQASAKK